MSRRRTSEYACPVCGSSCNIEYIDSRTIRAIITGETTCTITEDTEDGYTNVTCSLDITHDIPDTVRNACIELFINTDPF